jgi:hypothetical protein
MYIYIQSFYQDDDEGDASLLKLKVRNECRKELQAYGVMDEKGNMLDNIMEEGGGKVGTPDSMTDSSSSTGIATKTLSDHNLNTFEGHILRKNTFRDFKVQRNDLKHIFPSIHRNS